MSFAYGPFKEAFVHCFELFFNADHWNATSTAIALRRWFSARMSETPENFVARPTTRSQRKSQKRRQKRHVARTQDTSKPTVAEMPQTHEQTNVEKDQESDDDTLLVSYDDQDVAHEREQPHTQNGAEEDQPNDLLANMLVLKGEAIIDANIEANVDDEASVAFDVAESLFSVAEKEAANSNCIGRSSVHNRVNWAQFSLSDFHLTFTVPTHPSAQWQTPARTTRALWGN